MICMHWIIAPPTGPVPNPPATKWPRMSTNRGTGPCGWGARFNLKRIRTPSCSRSTFRNSGGTGSKPENLVWAGWGPTISRHQISSQCQCVSHVKHMKGMEFQLMGRCSMSRPNSNLVFLCFWRSSRDSKHGKTCQSQWLFQTFAPNS